MGAGRTAFDLGLVFLGADQPLVPEPGQCLVGAGHRFGQWGLDLVGARIARVGARLGLAGLAGGLACLCDRLFLQFVGHYFEGRKPAFVDDLSGLLVGPMFVVGEVLMSVGLLQRMRLDIERQAGVTR